MARTNDLRADLDGDQNVILYTVYASAMKIRPKMPLLESPQECRQERRFWSIRTETTVLIFQKSGMRTTTTQPDTLLATG